MNGFFYGYPYINSYIPNMMPINYGINNAFRMNPMMMPRALSPLAKLTKSTIGSNPGILSGTSGIGASIKNLSWTNVLNGASKTLGVINQAIPVVHQIRPIWNNAKTMLRVMKAVNTDNNSTNDINIKNNTSDIKNVSTNQDNTISNDNADPSKSYEGPVFFS